MSMWIMSVHLYGRGEVVLAWTDDRNDPQRELSQASLEVLKKRPMPEEGNLRFTSCRFRKNRFALRKKNWRDFGLRRARICGMQENVWLQVM